MIRYLYIIAACSICFTSMAQSTGTFTDPRDGKVYGWVQIGQQVWMSENIAFEPVTGNWWVYNNNPYYTPKYGYLYDWQTALQVCPPGWHLPDDTEWTRLESFIGGSNIAGGKLKTTSGWSNNGYGTDDLGFSALPGGMRKQYGEFSYLGITGRWWTSTEYSSNRAIYRRLYFYKSSVTDGELKHSGLSVRCLRNK
jgi:uncharacterized protein (TIGR02145 family)